MGKGGIELISYKPLWKTMKHKNITTYTLITRHGISKQTIHKLKHDESTTLNTINNLCTILQCRIEEVVLITPDKIEINI